MFRKYHYLNNSILVSARCFIAFYNKIPVAFEAIVKLFSRYSKNIYRGHRVVTLPDYQGVGIGVNLINYVAEYLKQNNFRFVWTSSNPALINYCKYDKKWKLTFYGRKSKHMGKFISGSEKRVTTSWEYTGETK